MKPAELRQHTLPRPTGRRSARFGLGALLTVLRSSAFARDLRELSAYGARIKHERPIVLFCAKYLWRSGHDVIVEGGKHDLTVDGVTFEFKQHYDWDIPKAHKESERWQPPRRRKHETWRVLPEIHWDIIEKRPDVFVWIISERGLDGIDDFCKDHVCFWKDQFRYGKGGWTSDQILPMANAMLNRIAVGRGRRGTRHSVSVETRARFVSTYHFLIRGFPKRSRST